MKFYISGSITGTTDYLERFAKAEEYILGIKHSVINPAKILQYMPKDTTHEEYMKLSIEMLKMCDSIYMLSGWENSNGANREYGYALGKGMNIVFERR